MDKQKNKVYRWEKWFVAPNDNTVVLFAQIEPIVRYIWAAEGWEYPPQVLPMVRKQTKKADANRIVMRFGEKTHTWVILHELAHSATSLCDGRSNHHGALFAGMYLQLLSKYLHLDLNALKDSARAAGIKVADDVKPLFEGS